MSFILLVKISVQLVHSKEPLPLRVNKRLNACKCFTSKACLVVFTIIHFCYEYPITFQTKLKSRGRAGDGGRVYTDNIHTGRTASGSHVLSSNRWKNL